MVHLDDEEKYQNQKRAPEGDGVYCGKRKPWHSGENKGTVPGPQRHQQPHESYRNGQQPDHPGSLIRLAKGLAFVRKIVHSFPKVVTRTRVQP